MPDQLALAAEKIVYDYEPSDVPRGLEVVERDDLLMWRTDLRHSWNNRVAYSRSSPERTEERIDEVFAFFVERPFSWCVGPSSRPADLAARLVARGLEPRPGRLMTAELPVIGLRTNPAVRIEEIDDPRDAERLVRFSREHWPEDRLRAAIEDRRRYLALPDRRGGFLIAHLDGRAVANAGYRYSSDGRFVYLTGAETREPYRNRGVYSTLVAYRTEAARRRGARHAAIRADPATSAPILLRRGFIDRGPFPIYERARGR